MHESPIPNRQAEFHQALSSYVGDQHAKDLIDQSYGETHEQAIPLLHQALAYGRTGIQAEKAYEELGSRYEQLGQTEQAIYYYTKALELNDSQTGSLFWRGELYFQSGEWEAARSDLSHALATHHAQRYFPEEYLLAQQRLIEIQQRLDNI
jgi:tetratricopeptide (TPR) repeat protein